MVDSGLRPESDLLRSGLAASGFQVHPRAELGLPRRVVQPRHPHGGAADLLAADPCHLGAVVLHHSGQRRQPGRLRLHPGDALPVGADAHRTGACRCCERPHSASDMRWSQLFCAPCPEGTVKLAELTPAAHFEFKTPVLMLTGRSFCCAWQGVPDGELPWYTKLIVALTAMFSVPVFVIPSSMLTWGFEAEVGSVWRPRSRDPDQRSAGREGRRRKGDDTDGRTDGRMDVEHGATA